ncbi:MAG: sigma factor-like helix-turn-helix DNA-binding protein [Planctomycetota bacterium]
MLKLGFIAERMLAKLRQEFTPGRVGLLALHDKYGFDYEGAFKKKEVREFIRRRLNRRDRLIIILSCGEELTMREIGEALDLPEARVCQLHTRINIQLRIHLWKVLTELLVSRYQLQLSPFLRGDRAPSPAGESP